MAEELVSRQELRATLATRAELGPEFEPELVERFAEQLERRLEGRTPPPARITSEQRTGITIVSLLAAIPLIAIAGGTVGLAGVIAVCAALVAVTYLAWRD